MILTDARIKQAIAEGQIIISPYSENRLGSNSYDVSLGDTLAVYTDEMLDAAKDNPVEYIHIPEDGVVLQPGKLYLGVTREYTSTTLHVPFLEGKSSTGRLGISIHATAGKGDIGFEGHWTLEIQVAQPVRVYKGMPIGQLIFFTIDGEVEKPYNIKSDAKYASQGALPVPSKMYLNLKHNRER